MSIPAESPLSRALARALAVASLLPVFLLMACRSTDVPDDAVTSSAITSSPFDKSGQAAWFHDEGDAYGVYHTYDAFSACGPPRKIHVLLPRDYESSGNTYPVVYMNDGNTAFWNGGIGGRSWHVTQTLGALAASIDRPIVIALEPNDRNAEYTYASWAPVQTCCGLDTYAQQVATCIKPWFDANYRTRPEARSNSIVGSSHGGLASYWMATRHPSAFGSAAALSPSFWAGIGGADVRSSQLVAPVTATLQSTARPALWIDWGLRRSEGYQDSVIEALATQYGKEMVGVLRDDFGYGPAELATFEDPLGGHDEDAWAYRFGLFVKWRLGKP